MDNVTKKSVIDAIAMVFSTAKKKQGNRELNTDTVADILAEYIEENFSDENAYTISKMVYECVKHELDRKEN